MMANGFIALPPDNSGKKLRTRTKTETGNEVHDEVVELADSSQNIINPAKEDGNLATIAGKDFATQTTLALIKAKTDNLDTALSGIKTGTDKIPASPSTLAGQQDSLSHYKIADSDDSSDPSYYGYTDKDGNWYILKITASTGAYRYAKGASDYTTNWTGRAGLSYDYYYTTF